MRSGLCCLLLTMHCQIAAQVSIPEDTVFQSPLKLEAVDSPFWQVRQRLQSARYFRAKFQQVHCLSEEPDPVITSGDFVFAREQGAYWELQAPLKALLVVHQDGMVQRDAWGVVRKISAGETPLVASVTKAIMAVLHGDLNEMQKNFTVYFEGNEESWSLGLIPRQRGWREALHHVTLRGARTVECLEIEEDNGNQTCIVFNDVDLKVKRLSDSEIQNFIH